MNSNSQVIQQQIDDCLSLLKSVLGQDLLGVYLYGSFLLGGLQKFSDIDLFAVSKRATTQAEKKQLESVLLKISGIYAVSKDLKPVELTIVVQPDIKPWQYPPKFDFLYGDWLRKDFEAGTIEPWPTKELPNLALVITQLLLSHQIVYGPSPDTLLDPVPYQNFILATTREIDSILNDIDWDTRNVLLTLARIWSTIETDTIRSKADAATWTISKLPAKYQRILERARAILLGEQEENWDDIKATVKPCADFIVEEIKKRMSMINASNDTNRSITIS